jgi:hypothetical protein
LSDAVEARSEQDLTVASASVSQGERVKANRELIAHLVAQLAEFGGAVTIAEVEAMPGFRCECADRLCQEKFVLRPPDYEATRKLSGCYLVAPGHRLDSATRVVLRTDAFEIVRAWP